MCSLSYEIWEDSLLNKLHSCHGSRRMQCNLLLGHSASDLIQPGKGKGREGIRALPSLVSVHRGTRKYQWLGSKMRVALTNLEGEGRNCNIWSELFSHGLRSYPVPCKKVKMSYSWWCCSWSLWQKTSPIARYFWKFLLKYCNHCFAVVSWGISYPTACLGLFETVSRTVKTMHSKLLTLNNPIITETATQWGLNQKRAYLSLSRSSEVKGCLAKYSMLKGKC